VSTALQVSSPDIKFALKIIQGPHKGDVYRISPPGLLIGRDATTCKIALMDPRISRQQCRIDFHPQGLSIEDLSGKNTTLVNGASIQQPHELQKGDQIQLGDTLLSFEIIESSTSSNLKVAPSFNMGLGQKKESPTTSTYSGPQKSYKGYMIIGALVAILVVLYFALPDKTKSGSSSKVQTTEELNKAIEEVQKRQQEIELAKGDLVDQSTQSYYNYYTAEKNYIRGLRDYQNGKYNRALEAFQTALAVNPKHPTARRYYRLAEKKRQESVDQHMDLGRKYKEKNQYRMCISEFEKVLQIINQPSQKKYQLAKEQIKECRLCQGGQCSDENAKKEVNGTSQN
jgi:pSer/pThr/pTyr-binding forkhead associated (FHA) protein